MVAARRSSLAESRLNHRLPGVSQITRITQATSIRCPTVFGVHIGTSPKKNHAPEHGSTSTHQTRELSGSAFSIGRRTEPKFRGMRRFASAKKLSFVGARAKALEIFDGLYGTVARYWRVIDVILTTPSLVIKNSFFTWSCRFLLFHCSMNSASPPKGFIKIPVPFPNRG